MRNRLLLVATLALLAAPLAADWHLFLPRPVRNGAYLDLFASHESDDNVYGTRSQHWNDTFFKEKFTLFSNGYAYDPRFLIYSVSLSGALKQERYELASLHPLPWRNDSGLEYKFRVLFLPEHPYSLELWALRYEPLYKEQSATRHNSLFTSRGADFKYRHKPYFFRSQYTENRVDSTASSSLVKRLGLEGEYFKRFKGGNEIALNANYIPSHFTSSSGLDGHSTEALVSNTLAIGRFHLFSSLTHTKLDQSDGAATPSYDSKQLDWYERMTAELPLNFRTDVSYRYDDGESDFAVPGGGPRRRLSTTGHNVEAQLVHRLYQSLQSIYTYRNGVRDSLGGSTSSFSHALGFNYSKSIPRGRVLAGIDWGRGETESRGSTDVVGEPHSGVAVPGTFVLDRSEADLATIAVFLKSPIAPYDTVQLQENVHYTISSLGNTYEIQVFSLPADFVVPGTYDFVVSYSQLYGNFRLRTDSFGHNASVELFDHLLTPYYSYSRVRSRVLSGYFPGIGLDTTNVTVGMRFLHGPLRGRVEYQDVSWEINPYTSWTGELQYVGALTPTTNVYATVSHIERRYGHGKSAYYLSGSRERLDSASANLQQRFMGRSLLWSIGGSYTRDRGLYETDAYALNSSLSWKVGKVDLSAGASVYDSQAQGLIQPTNRRTHYYYFLRLRRTFY